jgi:DNA (cytosine-5)-methyltransferase 1
MRACRDAAYQAGDSAEMTITFGSLFAGIGGFDLGFERAGMECAWQVEIDKDASSVLNHHWPDVPTIKDVRNVTGQSPTVDLICGGFPCQDVSVAGKRAGLAGKRSGLWFEFHRILSELTPRWVVVENVPGLLSSNGGADFAVILRGLVELGYGVAWRILDAQYFGVAQRRRRVFIVGSLGDGRAAEVLFEREGLPGDIAPRREAGSELARDVAASLRGRGKGTGTRIDNETQDSKLVVFEPRFARNGRGAPDTIAPPLKAQSGQTGKGDGAPVLAFVQNTRDEVRLMNGDGQITGALSAQPGMKQQSYISLPMSARVETGETVSTLDSQSGENRGGSEGKKVLTHSGVRRLTPTECERLQGFPDGWTDGQSDSKRYRQLGNAVAVPVAEWLGNQLMKALQ